MKTMTLRIFGYSLLVAAALGVVLSLMGLVFVWRILPALFVEAEETLDLLSDGLDATTGMLGSAETTLQEVVGSVALIEAAIGRTETTLGATSAATASIGELVGSELSGVVQETQAAMDTLEKTALLVDDTLQFVSAIPLIGARYRPEVPLQTSVAKVAESLGEMPAALAEVERGMKTTAGTFDALTTDMQEMSGSVSKIHENLVEVQETLGSYGALIDDLHKNVSQARSRLGYWLTLAKIGGSAFSVWLLLAQAALLLQGLHLLQRDTAASPKQE